MGKLKNIENFQNLIDKLQEKLAEKLPGELAHQKMEASSRLSLPKTPNEFTRNSAVLILFYPSENKILIPLILRPMYDGMHGGQVAFPGGRLEKTDENLTRTALREAQEEIGIRTSDVTIIGQLTELYIPPSNFLVQPIIGHMASKPNFYPDPKEVETVFEIELSEITDSQIVSNEILNIKGVEITAPTYNISGQKIWGATAMMISELLEIIK